VSGSSPARIASNRTNAQRSTGPRTIEGKTASSRNARKHGLLAVGQPVLPGEDPDVLDALDRYLHDELAPATAIEVLLVDEIVGLVWRLRRVARVEVALYSITMHAPALRALCGAGEADAALGFAFVENAPNFSVLSRYETALVHRLRRSLADLERLQGAREAPIPTMVVMPRGV
jgi:hypothetical protein